MPSVRFGNSGLWVEILLRLVFLIIFVQLQAMDPFERHISAEEMNTIYKSPRHASYVPSYVMWPVVLFFAPFCFLLNYCFKKDGLDLGQSLLAVTLSLGITGNITDILKLMAGRPRPDFYWRCFPNGDPISSDSFVCNGDLEDITEGRKSFPSGHSSLSFCSLGLLSLWLMGQLGVWSHRGSRSAPGFRLTASLCPIVAAMSIAISRTCDYHHHWQDVTAGSTLGFLIAYISYRQYYPPLTSVNSHRPLAAVSRTSGLGAINRRCSQDSLLPDNTSAPGEGQGYGSVDAYTSRWERSSLPRPSEPLSSPNQERPTTVQQTKWI